MRHLTDTHAHTVASTHAYSTVEEYFRAAADKGLQLFSITDHGPEMPDSPHPWHFGNMRVLPRIRYGVAMLRGIEANILSTEHRPLDVNETLMSFMDFGIASFHEPVFQPSDRKAHTQAMIAAMETGLIQILGHPGNPNYPINIEEVVRAARDNNVLIEINNSSFVSSRLGSEPYCIEILETVQALDWKVALSSDSHVHYTVGDVDTALEKIERIGFPEDKIVTLNARRLLEFLGEHRKPVARELSSWLDELESPDILEL
jgi:putative hydrolase